jgi:hypothetical protein
MLPFLDYDESGTLRDLYRPLVTMNGMTQAPLH